MTSAAKRRWKPRHLRRLARALAELAANLAHDLNNQIGAVIALSAELAFHVEGAEDQRALRELEQGAKAGAAALTALAKMLVRTPARRERVDAGALVEDAAALISKAFEQQGVGLTWRVAAGLPPTRVVYVDVLHSVSSVLRALLDRSPERVEVAVQLRQLAISGGRLRDYVVCAAEVFFADVAASAALSGFAELAPETLRTIGTASGRGQELVTAALLQRRLGGELRVEVEGARVTVTFLWPAAR
ncbi:MAG: hypothetical protein VXY92_03935 [Planctomycetota bacterium]|nr:hypothetical protein [Planctomycetota bacterium]